MRDQWKLEWLNNAWKNLNTRTEKCAMTEMNNEQCPMNGN